MSGGFFRGTSADQDTRFSNKNAKLLKTQKFAPELDEPVDFGKVKLDVIKPWIAKRVTEILGGVEDDVLINLIYALLEERKDGKQIQIQITGFLEKNTSKFMKELWSLLLSAQKNISGVPQQFIDAKAEEARRKKEFDDRINLEVQRLRQVHEQEQAATAEHNRKLTADVEAAKLAAAEAAARLSQQILEQRDHKTLEPSTKISSDQGGDPIEKGDGPDEAAGDPSGKGGGPNDAVEDKEQDEPKQQSARSPNPSDRSRSPDRRMSRSPPRRGRSRSRSPSRGSPYRPSPPRYKQRHRSPAYDNGRSGGKYYNGRSSYMYSGRRDNERDWHRRPSERPYDRLESERYRGRRGDYSRDAYVDRSTMRRGPGRMERRLAHDGRRAVYDDRHMERGRVGDKRPYRDVEDRRPVSVSPAEERVPRVASEDREMEREREEGVKHASSRGRPAVKGGSDDDLEDNPPPVVKREVGRRRELESSRGMGSKKPQADSRMETVARVERGRKEMPVSVVEESSEEELAQEKSARREVEQEVDVVAKDSKVADDGNDGDISPADSTERRELKRRKKEERRARKEERRKRREERKRQKEERRATKEAKGELNPEGEVRQGRSNGQVEYGGHSEDGGDAISADMQKQLEEDLRKKALESLRAKKMRVA